MISKTTLARKRLLVVGDSMLDRYWFGDTNRISPEAPVPVVRIVKNEDRLGGAANVALNIAELGASATLMSVIGNDDAGKSLQSLLAAAGFERYEVASYAKPGYECRHNIAYWTGVPYLGIGTSAATMTQNSERRMRMTDGSVTDDLNAEQMVAEDLMLGMRMTRGVSGEKIAEARLVLPRLDETIDKLIEEGLAAWSEGRLRPTERGWLLGNELYGALFDLA